MVAEIEMTVTPNYNQQNGDELVPARGSLETYEFPTHRLKQVMDDPSKTPLVLVAAGSFSPPTYLHLRMQYVRRNYLAVA